MYLGELAEVATADQLYSRPAHPYTEALLSAIPRMEGDDAGREQIVLRGDVPSPIDKPSGCTFHTRCPWARDRCVTEKPVLQIVAGRFGRLPLPAHRHRLSAVEPYAGGIASGVMCRHLNR